MSSRPSDSTSDGDPGLPRKVLISTRVSTRGLPRRWMTSYLTLSHELAIAQSFKTLQSQSVVVADDVAAGERWLRAMDLLFCSAILGRLAFFTGFDIGKIRISSSYSSSSGNNSSNRRYGGRARVLAECSREGVSRGRRSRGAVWRACQKGSQANGKTASNCEGFAAAQNAAGSNGAGDIGIPVEQPVVASQGTCELVPGKAVVTGIKTAHLLLKGIKTVHGVMILLEAQGGNVVALGSPDGLVLGYKAAKVVIKGVKMSHKALKSRVQNTTVFGSMQWFKDMTTGLKASFGALNVVKGGKAIITAIADGRVGLMNWNLIVKGYEASKGALNTVEALSSLKVGCVSIFGKGVLSLKGAIEGVGVMIKACAVSKELYVFVIKGLGLSHGAREVIKIIADGRKVSKPLADVQKITGIKTLSSRTFSRRSCLKTGTFMWNCLVLTRANASLAMCLSVYNNTSLQQTTRMLDLLLSLQGVTTSSSQRATQNSFVAASSSSQF